MPQKISSRLARSKRKTKIIPFTIIIIAKISRTLFGTILSKNKLIVNRITAARSIIPSSFIIKKLV